MGICYTEGCRRAEKWEYVTQRGVDEQRMGICYTEGCRRAENGNMLHRGV